MHLSLAALAACVAAADAFKDTSPFLFFSSSQLLPGLQESSVAQVQSSQAVLKTTKEFLGSCPSDVYYILHQPSIHSTDLSPSAIPNLHAALSSSTVKSKYLVAETSGLGTDSKQEVVAYLQEKCGETVFLDRDASVQTAETLDSHVSRVLKDGKKAIILRTMEELAGSRKSTQRAAMLDKIDQSLNFELSAVTANPSYTVIWTTTPPVEDGADVEPYEPEFQDPLHMELKRDVSEGASKKFGNITDHRPLFEKYQYLTPGIFMGLLTGLILVAILSVGMKAISSLQVSYAAFDKDMGPAAQKKQQ